MLLLLSAGCGGGGGGGGRGDGPVRPPSFFETAEYDASFGLGAIGASSVYADGATGRGIKVAVIDTGIDVDHPEFAGAIDPASRNVIGVPSDFDDADGHGTAVAGVIGARRNGALSHGVAFDAGLLVVQAARGCASGCLFDQSDVAAATDYAVAQGARVINYSLGGTSTLASDLESALARAADAGAILVFAAGNDGASRPTLPARFAGSDRAGGRAVAVGAVDADRRIASFSNRAGSLQEAFLVAPGVGVAAPRLGGGLASFSGTSFATPHVAGGAALLLEAAPFLSAEEVVRLLLDSARDLGPAGTDGTYGHGLIDLAAALGPQGTLGVPLGSSADGPAAPLAGSGLALGSAFGPAPGLPRGIFLDGYGRPYEWHVDRRVRASDRRPDLLGWLAPGSDAARAPVLPEADLHLDVASDLSAVDPFSRPDGEQDPRFALTTGLGDAAELTVARRWGLGGHFGLGALGPGAVSGGLSRVGASPYLGFVSGGDGLILAGSPGRGVTLRAAFAEAEPSAAGLPRGSRTVAVAELAKTFESGAAAALQAGSLAEQASLLDAAGGGALATGGASTGFLGIALQLPIRAPVPGDGRWSWFGEAHYGLTRAHGAEGSLLRESSPLHSTSFATGLAGQGLVRAGDRLALSVSQPIRVEAGSMVLDLPVARTFDGTIVRGAERVDLAPTGREVDIELAYRMPLGRAMRLSLVGLTRIEPGHDPDASPAHAIGARWQARF